MSPRDALHQLVNDLPKGDLPVAAEDPICRALAQAPIDDELDGDDRDGGLTEARAEADAGAGLSTQELRGRLGLA